jgi:hypothetical protein
MAGHTGKNWPAVLVNVTMGHIWEVLELYDLLN